MKPGVRSFMWYPHESYMGGRDLSTWTILCCPFQVNQQKAELEMEQVGHKLVPIWNASIAGNGFTNYMTILAQKLILGLIEDSYFVERKNRHGFYVLSTQFLPLTIFLQNCSMIITTRKLIQT